MSLRVKLIAVAAVVVLVGVALAGYRLYDRRADRAALCDTVEQTESKAASKRAAILERTAGRPVMVFLGDSYTQGQWLDDPTQAFPYVAAADLDASPVVSGSGGSGIQNDGPCGDDTLGDRVEVVTSDAQTVVVQAGLNDLADADGEQDATEDLLATIAKDAPDADVVVVGPPLAPGVDVDSIGATADALRAAADAAGASFVDLRDLDVTFDPANNHPDVAGHRAIGEAVAEAIKRAG